VENQPADLKNDAPTRKGETRMLNTAHLSRRRGLALEKMRTTLDNLQAFTAPVEIKNS
jgi:hypothetical protein